MNRCEHDLNPRMVYALPYIGNTELCPICALELGERLNFKASEAQVLKAIKAVRRSITKQLLEAFFVSDEWQDHIEYCSDCGFDESETFKESCYSGKVIFLRHFAKVA